MYISMSLFSRMKDGAFYPPPPTRTNAMDQHRALAAWLAGPCDRWLGLRSPDGRWAAAETGRPAGVRPRPALTSNESGPAAVRLQCDCVLCVDRRRVVLCGLEGVP